MRKLSKLRVIKKDGRRESFDLLKLKKSIELAFTTSGVEDDIEKFVDDIINDIIEGGYKEIKSSELSDLVEKAFVSRLVSNPGLEKAAKVYVLSRIYNEVYGKNNWKGFDPVDMGFTYPALRVLYQRYLIKNHETGKVTETPRQLLHRVAHNIALAESPEKRDFWTEEFLKLMASRRFIPNSPTLFNAGTKLGILSACFVIPVRDAITTENNDGIYDSVRTQAIVFQQGGGCGFDFSELRPEGDVVLSTGGVASGPLSFMRIFDVNTDVIKQGGRRRGANMGVMHIWHPDIMKFIRSKTGEMKDRLLQNFNISVGIYDYFMKAIAEGKEVPLINPRKTSVDKSANSRKYGIVWSRHYMSEDWVQEFIIKELEEKGGSISLEDSLIITWDEALAIAEAENAIVKWIDPAEVFDEITKAAWEGGDPGLLFIDTINRRHPTWYLGKINATNPCVAEDTLVLTPRGWLRAKDIFLEAKKQGIAVGVSIDENLLGEGGEPIAYRTNLITVVGRETVYRNKHNRKLKLLVPQKTEAWVWYLGKKQGLRVETKEGYEITVTSEHKFLTKEGWKAAGDLKAGDKILLGRIHPAFTEGIIDNGNEIDNDVAFALGWIYGAGTINGEYVAWYFREKGSAAEERVRRGIVKLGGNPLSHTYLLSRSKHKIKVRYSRGTRVYNSVLELVNDYFEGGSRDRLPDLVFKMAPKSLLAFLRGIFTAGGYVDGEGRIKLTSPSPHLLKEIQVILTQFGISSAIFERHEDEWKYDGSTGYYELVVEDYSKEIFKHLIGFEDISKMERLTSASYEMGSPWATVIKVVDVGLVNFYDFTVPLTHNYVANGIINHNCGEEPLLEWESCNLGSINLEKYVIEENGFSTVDWISLANDIRVAVRFLDDVISVAKYPIPQLAEAARRARKIGLGVMGWAHLLVRLGIRYDSPDAAYLGYILSEWIAYNAYKASVELAKEKGVFPAWNAELYRPFWKSALSFDKIKRLAGIGEVSEKVKKIVSGRPNVDWEELNNEIKKYGLRNAALLSIAPTGTISIIAGTTSSIEPIFALAYTRMVTVGTFIEVDNLFLEALKKFGLDDPEVIQLVAETGSIAHNPFMPRPLREVYRTAHDIEPKWHVVHQAVWQQWVDAGVSKTVNLRNEATVDDVKEVYTLAWVLGCKGITVYRDKSKSQQVISFGVKLARNIGREVSPEDLTSIKVRGTETILPERVTKDKKGGDEYMPIFANNKGQGSSDADRGKDYSRKGNPFRITGVILEDGDVGDCSTCEY